MKNNVGFFFEQVKYLGTGVNNTENFTLKYWICYILKLLINEYIQ